MPGAIYAAQGDVKVAAFMDSPRIKLLEVRICSNGAVDLPEVAVSSANRIRLFAQRAIARSSASLVTPDAASANPAASDAVTNTGKRQGETYAFGRLSAATRLRR